MNNLISGEGTVYKLMLAFQNQGKTRPGEHHSTWKTKLREGERGTPKIVKLVVSKNQMTVN